MGKFVGLRLYNDANAVRHLDAILVEGVVRLTPEGEDFERPLGYYDMDWRPVDDPTGK